MIYLEKGERFLSFITIDSSIRKVQSTMKSICLLCVLAALLIGCMACTPRADEPKADAHDVTSAAASTQPEQPQNAESATFVVTYNNADAIELTILIPKGWHDAGQYFASADGGGRIDFHHVSQLDGDGGMSAYWEGVDAEYADVAIAADLDIPGMVGKRYYMFPIENADGTEFHLLRYYILIENVAIVGQLIPASGIDIETQCAEFEACLATLKLGLIIHAKAEAPK